MTTVPRLAPGDQVALVAPAGPPDHQRTEAGVRLLRSWGLEPRVLPNAFASSAHGYLAADDTGRLADLHAAWRDPAIRGIFALRGGYGTQRLLHRIDWSLVRASPKLVVGFSDCTVLLLGLWRHTGQVAIHGPGVAAEPARLGAAAERWWRRVLTSAQPLGDLPARGRCLVDGVAEGALLGGNLTMLSTSVGTPEHPSFAGAVVLLEDVGERPYAVDRALLHLRRAGVLEGAVGLVFDAFHGCVEDRPGRRSTTVGEIIAEHAAELGVPAVADLPVGHGPGQLAVPFGVRCRLDAGAGTLRFLDAALR